MPYTIFLGGGYNVGARHRYINLEWELVLNEFTKLGVEVQPVSQLPLCLPNQSTWLPQVTAQSQSSHVIVVQWRRTYANVG